MALVPQVIQDLAHADRIVPSRHAQDGLEANGLGIDDVIESLLKGTLVKQERDPKGPGKIYTIVGPALSGRKVYTTGKILEVADGSAYFLITAHKADE